MIKIFIGLLLLSATSQRCLEGCLRCTPENKCLYCDVLNGYQLRSERCVKPQIPNCLLTNDKMQCISCQPAFYLDETLNQCIELIPEIKVLNCEIHKGPSLCKLCEIGYYLKNGACNKIQAPIPNCRIENERGICLQCSNDFIRSIDKKSCSQRMEINKCQTQKWVTCRNCAPGFVNNQNFYLDILFSLRKQKVLDEIHDELKVNIRNAAEGKYFPTCQRIEVQNCKVLDSFNKCKQCLPGYFVNELKQCQPNPKETIPYCLRYNSLTTCIACTQGYHLKEERCVKAYNIENCMIYSNEKQTTVCTRCFDDYYLSAENLCTKRTDLSNIPLCVRLSNNFEKCDQCLEGYIATSDGFRCLGVIKNCLNYETSNKNDIYLRCSLCRDGYYYNVENRICIKGTVDYCNRYALKEDKCIECKAKFYLVENKCEPQKQLHYCQKYHKTAPNTCVSCDQNSFLFSTIQSCQKVDVIPRCEVYGSKTSCLKCKDGYYLRNPSYCEQIPLKENCLQKSGNNCIKCLPHYALLMGQCIKAYSWVSQGCLKNNLQGTVDIDKLECSSCKKNFVPINSSSTFLCHEVKTLHRVFNINKDQNFDKDCLQYRFNNGNYTCVKCRDERVLVDGFCKENCYQQGKLTLYRQWITLHNVTGEAFNDSIRVEYTNICEKTIPNCAVASLNLDQDFVDVKYSCEQCVDGFIPITDLKNSYGVISKSERKERQLYVHMPVTSSPGVICVDPKQNTMLGDLNWRKQIDFCEYYLRISKNSFGCRKCYHGKTGSTIQAIKQCRIFKNPFECMECEQGYFLKESNECRPITKIEFCFKYDPKESESKCIECLPSHYLSDEKCIPRVESLNKSNCTLKIDGDECTCTSNYVKHPNTKNCLRKPDFCVDTTIDNEVFKCSTCDRSKSYLKDNDCKIGTTPYCKQFKLTENECETCLNGYYMDNKTCKLHTPNLDNLCDIWNPTSKNVCNKCKPQATKFKKLKHCKEVNEVIQNCKVYSDIFSCKECEEGYYLNNVSKRCLKIPPSTHCLQLKVVDLQNTTLFDKNDYTEQIRFVYSCDKCEANYHRRQYSINEKFYVDGSQNTQNLNLFRCINWLGYHTENCTTTDTDIKGQENFSNFCYGCATNFIPFDVKDKYVCVNKKYIPERKNGFTVDANCTAYSFDSSRNMNCDLCKDGFYLDSSTNSCVDGSTNTCTNPNKPFKFYINSNSKIKRNVCAALINAAITGCNSYVTSYTQTSNTAAWVRSESCYECAANNYRIFLAQTPPAKHVTPINVIDQDLTIKHYDQMFPALSCSALTVSGLVKNSAIDNCAVYKTNTTSNKTYCARCKQGYTGRIFTDGTDQGIETCEKMTTCATGDVLGGLQLNTPLLEAKIHPIALFSCQKCSETGKIPVVFVNDVTATFYPADAQIYKLFRTSFAKNDVEKFTDYTTATLVALSNSNQAGNAYVVQCWDETKLESTTNPTATDVLSLSTANRIPTNCGLALLDVNSKKDNVSCVACKPGFKINGYDGTQTWRVNDCVQIATCPTDKNALNRCSGCTWKYNSLTDTVDTTPDSSCIVAKQGNCFAGVMNGTTLECHVCDPGYELMNKKCLIIKIPRCDAGSNNFYDTFNEGHLMIGSRMFQYSMVGNKILLPGCQKCESDDDILYKNSSTDDYMHRTICTQILDTNGAYSSSLNTTYITDNFSSLTNCSRYGYKNSKYICVQCQNGHRLNKADYSCSTIQTGMTNLLPNCLISQTSNDTICQLCENGYINIGGLCRSATDTSYVDSNCLTFAQGQKSTYQSICAKCKTGYYAKITVSPFNRCTLIPDTETNCIDYLDETGCVDCAAGYGLTLVRKLNSEQTKRICVKLDLTTDNLYAHDPKCEKLTVVANSESLQQQRLICRKCLPHSVLTSDFIDYKEQCYPIFPEISHCVKYDSPDPELDILGSQLQKIQEKDFKCLECDDPKVYYLDRIKNKCLERTVINNCTTYDLLADRCKVCGQGFQLSVDMRSCFNFKNNKTIGYLDGCRDIEGCNGNKVYEGLESDLNTVYTCHKCLRDWEIPFAIGTIALNENIKGFETFINANEVDSKFKPWQNTNIDPESMVRCLKPVQETFSLTTNFQFPANCGLGFVNVGPLLDNDIDHNAAHSTGNGTFDYKKTTIRCHACKPGFKPSRQSFTINGKAQDLRLLVTQCTAIQNCENSSWFNGCSQCQAGYAHPFNEGRTHFDQCIQVPEHQKECWSYDSNSARCIFCKKGTYLNKDFVCELINPPNCQHREFKFNQIYTFGILHQGIYSAPDFVGCNRCEEGFVGVEVPEQRQVCVSSLYHINKTLVTDTLYIRDCVEYSLKYNNSLICLKCNDGFVLSRNRKRCYENTNLGNCIDASSEGNCNICAPGFVMVNRQCVKESIENCALYAKDSPDCRFCNQHEQICLQCKPEYYLEGNQCIPGLIRNCKIQETALICKECQEDFTLILSKNHTSYCYPNDPRFKCKAFKRDLFQAQVLQCDQCWDSTYVLSNSETDKSVTSCMQFKFTHYCLKYDNNPIALGNSSFRCVECELDYFIKDAKCVLREIRPNECIKYKFDEDLCLQCQVGYFINTDGKSCVAYPQGIQGCEIYLSENNCVKCLPDFYEKNQICLPVIQKLENCIYYEDDGICQECEAGFQVIQGQCFQILAQNCLTIESIKECLTCPKGFYLKTEKGITSCIQTTIANCEEVMLNEPYDCLKCTGNFYPNKQECVAVVNLIPFCQIYSTATTCEKCLAPSALSTDKATCVKTPELMNHIDLDCSDNVMNKEPVCNTCQPGFIFQYEKCVACRTGVGCMICNPYNRSECLLCSPHYIMTPEGKCLKPMVESSGLDNLGRSLSEFNADDVMMRRL